MGWERWEEWVGRRPEGEDWVGEMRGEVWAGRGVDEEEERVSECRVSGCGGDGTGVGGGRREPPPPFPSLPTDPCPFLSPDPPMPLSAPLPHSFLSPPLMYAYFWMSESPSCKLLGALTCGTIMPEKDTMGQPGLLFSKCLLGPISRTPVL